MLSGCACAAQCTETSVRDIEMRLSARLYQGQEVEPKQHSKEKLWLSNVQPPLTSDGIDGLQETAALDLVKMLSARIFSSQSVLWYPFLLQLAFHDILVDLRRSSYLECSDKRYK